MQGHILSSTKAEVYRKVHNPLDDPLRNMADSGSAYRSLHRPPDVSTKECGSPHGNANRCSRYEVCNIDLIVICLCSKQDTL